MSGTKKVADGSPCAQCKRPTPTQAQWDYDGPLHGNGNGCECPECCAMCWGDPTDCARAARGEKPVSRYTQEIVDAMIRVAVEEEREACARLAATCGGYPDTVASVAVLGSHLSTAIRARGAW